MKSRTGTEQEQSLTQCDVAIVGMSCLFAGAPDLYSYWRNIVSKVDAISDPPSDDWDPKVFYDPSSKSNDRVYCKRGGYINDLAEFRPSDFGVMPVTVDGGEPDQWLAVRVAFQALADAGYRESPKEHLRAEVILGKGTYINRGNLTVGYHGMIIEQVLQVLRGLHPEYTEAEVAQIKQELKGTLPPFNADTAPALIGNIIAGRIANRLDLMGPSFTVDAACASALVALDIGVRDLLSGKCDLVLAGGANVSAPLPTLSLFCQLGALSRKERIRPFDKDADGTILGEGLGMVVLKRREDAERDGNRIYALIKGVGIASDGRALHVMAPRVEGEELALRRAYEMADVSPATIGLIEAHGTATPVGDVTELQALQRVFGERHGSLPSCALGSVKSMIGHTMPAAGIAGVIKTALSLYHRVLPPTLNCEKPNPALNLGKTPFYINTEVRPWIHGRETPRRAGVNSFGFGGINGHAVLEEYSGKPEQQGYLLEWDSEVFIFEGASRQALIDEGHRLRNYLVHSGDVPLRDIAYALNSQLVDGAFRLAIVAESKADLTEKLGHALGRVADPKCRQIKDNKGIYFFEERLKGKLAFLFPGEGAQYPDMLLDLCLHFPEVRSCFDLADRALARGSRECLPSDFIFPRSLLSETERAEVEKRIWEIDGAVEGVLIANRAIWTLLNQLGIRPDVIVGHSTGDYSAMLASNIIEISDEAKYMETVLAWNRAHHKIEKEMDVPEAALLAVAADPATVKSVMDAVSGQLYLAMENCPHQSVVVGDKELIEEAIKHLQQRGIMYELLAFDRPYHTPMFRAYAEGAAREFFSRLQISAPQVETYSCTTAAVYPKSGDEIRDLYIAHWVLPVLFSKTIETMYADGVRFFVEAGPRGNLTAFVGDILRGKPHLAMPANIARRSGITQLNHLVGILAAQGIGVRLDYLYTRRNPKPVSFDSAPPKAPAKAAPPAMKVMISMPPLKVAPRPAAVPPSAKPSAAVVSRNGDSHESPGHKIAIPLPVASRPQPVVPRPTRNGTSLVMEEYMKGMEKFLDLEQQTMASFLGRARGPASGKAATTPRHSAEVAFPLLGTITSLVSGQELTAVRHLNLDDDLFLREHALGGPVSTTDPTLRPMIVLPLTMSMELLAEAASALMPGKVLIGMRDVQAHHWIRVDDASLELQISARRLATSYGEVEVQIRDIVPSTGPKSTATSPAVRGILTFADAFPKPPQAAPFALASERVSSLASANLYDGRLMFHGPCFQGVASIDRSGRDGVLGHLTVLPANNLFRTAPEPRFVTDPVALDAAGQLVGFWAAEYLESGFVVFPYRLETLSIYGPNRPAGEQLTCRLKLQMIGNERIRSTIEVLGGDGTLWMELRGWEDRRFDPPKRFHHAWIAPDEALISESWETPLRDVPAKNSLECYRIENLFEPGDSLWTDLWASLVLSRNERKDFAQRQSPEKRRLEWLSARTAAKDAIRSLLKRHYGLDLLPADIEIAQDEHGRPFPQGSWTNRLRTIPGLSLTHSNGTAVALAGNGNSHCFGIDIQVVHELAPNFVNIAFTADEQLLFGSMPGSSRTEWVLRLWCTKEAVAKALGRGLLEGPSSVRIISADTKTGIVRARPVGKLAAEVPHISRNELVTYTAREGEYVFATSFYEGGSDGRN